MCEKEAKSECWESKVMVFERKEVEVVDFITSYRVSVPVAGRCEIVRRRENGGSEKVSIWGRCYTNLER